MRRTMKAKAMKPGQEFKVEGRWYRLSEDPRPGPERCYALAALDIEAGQEDLIIIDNRSVEVRGNPTVPE